MSTIIDEDFESGTVDALVSTSNTSFTRVATTSTMAFSSTAKRGSLGAAIVGNPASYGAIALSDINDVYLRFYFNTASIPSADQVFIAGVSTTGGVVAAQLRIMTDGTLQIRDHYTKAGQTDAVLPINTWVRIEWHVSNTNASQTMRLFSLGNADGDTPDETITGDYTGADTFAEVQFGQTGGSPGASWFATYDDCGVSDSDWLGSTTTGATTVTVTNPGPQSAVVGVSKSLTMQGSTTGAGSLTWTATGLPDGLAIASGTGIIQGTPTTVQTTTCTVTGTDSTSNSDSVTFTWSVASSTSDSGYPVHEDFESGTDTNAISNGDTALDDILGSVSFDSTHTAYGSLAGLFDTSSPAARATGSIAIPADIADDFVIRWFVYITDWQKGYLASVHTPTGGGGGADLRLNAGGTLSPRNGYIAIGTSSVTLPKNEWSRLEWNISQATGSQELRIFTDGAAFSSGSPTESILGNYDDVVPTDVALGEISFDAENFKSWIDNIAVSSDWIGPPGASPAPTGSYVRHMWDGGAWVPTETATTW